MTKLVDIKATSRLARLKLEELRRLRYESYRLDPLLWAEEVLGEGRENFEWSRHGGEYDNHIWDGDVNPLSTAWRTITNPKESLNVEGTIIPKNWIAVQAATGTAKTFWLARLAMWYLDCFDNCLIVTSAPKESQLSINLWSELSRINNKVRKVRPFLQTNKLRIRAEGENPSDIDTKESHEMIGFVAGVGADEESATKAQGFHRKHMLIICEEMAGMNPAIVKAFINTCTASTNIIVGVGNPDSEHDQLHQFGKMARVKPFRISALDFPNVVLGKEVYPGAASRISVAARKNDFGEDSAIYQSRVRGITPQDSSDAVIQGSWIDACDKHHEHFKGYAKLPGHNGVGVDVANSETGDLGALAWFDTNELHHVHEFRCPNATHLAYNLIFEDYELMQQNYTVYSTLKVKTQRISAQMIGVDSVGVGIATVNAFLDKGYQGVQSLSGGAWTDNGIIPIDPVTKKPLYEFANLRTQMYWELRQDINHGRFLFDIKDRKMMQHIKRELTVAKYKLQGGKISIESKEDIKKRLGKSPNVADAIVYGNWVRKGYRIKVSGLPRKLG